MSDMTQLPNIGSWLEEQLAQANITTPEELEAVGSREAWLRIKAIDPSACLIHLSMLEGAIRGIHWDYLDANTKKKLRYFRGLINLFEESNTLFLNTDIDLITSDVAERALCASLMCTIRNNIAKTEFRNYNVDTEYNRNQGKIKTVLNDKLEVVVVNCDLIVHSRGMIVEQDNLLALEMKKASRPEAEKEDDRKRLMALTKCSYDNIWSADGITLPEHVCGYILGVFYEINKKLRSVSIEYYFEGRQIFKYSINLFEYKSLVSEVP